jgi:hypothetical protein
MSNIDDIPAGINFNRQKSLETESIERRLMFLEEQVDIAWETELCILMLLLDGFNR